MTLTMQMSPTIYTAITFAPVQGFIEKSRKLRDLYGSSFLLSYLAKEICQAAKDQDLEVISPALIDVTRGTPNQIIIKGYFIEELARKSLLDAWKKICHDCREWIERNLPNYPYHWHREWDAWSNHAWEFFWAKGESISLARRQLNEQKKARDWTGINWHGESSTLSGADSIAWYGMSDLAHPTKSSISEQSDKIEEFYINLSLKVSSAILDPAERLSIPELIKRLIPRIRNIELPENFSDLNRHSEDNFYTGWFQGDGDRIGEFLKDKSQLGNESEALNSFSKAMMEWGKDLQKYLPSAEDSTNKEAKGKIIYAGGDDFLGVLYAKKTQLKPQECLQWFYKFHNEIWPKHQQGIKVSVGFVWAAPGVPQRDVLQHCRQTERSAKDQGRDRLAIRILFNSGNYLEWACPWEHIQDILTSYQDRLGKKNWTHFYNDVATLESRHAFTKDSSDVALSLFEIYFKKAQKNPKLIVGDEDHQRLNEWIINLAKVGFHLHV